MRSLLALSAAGLAAVVAPVLADEPTLYAVKEMVVGTMIPQPVITSRVPFDKTYAELSGEQKAIVAQDYESLAAGDEPPFPAYGLNHMANYLTRFADKVKPVGPLVAAVEVSPDGHARSVTVYKSPDPQLTTLVSTLMVNEDFKPAKCKGSPCAMQYVLRLDFPVRNSQHVNGTGRMDNLGGMHGGF